MKTRIECQITYVAGPKEHKCPMIISLEWTKLLRRTCCRSCDQIWSISTYNNGPCQTHMGSLVINRYFTKYCYLALKWPAATCLRFILEDDFELAKRVDSKAWNNLYQLSMRNKCKKFVKLHRNPVIHAQINVCRLLRLTFLFIK